MKFDCFAPLALPLLLSSTLACASAGRGGTAGPVELALAPYVAGLRTVKLAVGGRPVDLIFDTAGGMTLLTPELARESGCHPFGRLTGFRHNGDPLALERCAPIEVAAGAWHTRRELAVFDLTPLLGDAPPVAGIAGLDLFEGEKLTVDLGAGRVTIETPASFAAKIRGAAPVMLRAGRQSGGASLDIFLAIEAPSGPLWMELDSGSVVPALLAPHAARALGIELDSATPKKVELTVAGLGRVSVDATEREMIYDGLLGARFVGEFVWMIDLGTMRAWARRR